MKKLITLIIAVNILVPSLTFAQTVNLKTTYNSTLRQLIALLVQEVAQLEQQLAALNAKQNVSQQIASSTMAPLTTTPAVTSAATTTPSPQQTTTQIMQTTQATNMPPVNSTSTQSGSTAGSQPIVITIAQNPSFTASSFTWQNNSNGEVASFILANQSAQIVPVTELPWMADVATLWDVQMMVNGQQVSGEPSEVHRGQIWVGGGSNISVPANGSVEVDFVAQNVPSLATGTYPSAISICGAGTQGLNSTVTATFKDANGNSLNYPNDGCNDAVAGQPITVQ